MTAKLISDVGPRCTDISKLTLIKAIADDPVSEGRSGPDFNLISRGAEEDPQRIIAVGNRNKAPELEQLKLCLLRQGGWYSDFSRNQVPKRALRAALVIDPVFDHIRASRTNGSR